MYHVRTHHSWRNNARSAGRSQFAFGVEMHPADDNDLKQEELDPNHGACQPGCDDKPVEAEMWGVLARGGSAFFLQPPHDHDVVRGDGGQKAHCNG